LKFTDRCTTSPQTEHVKTLGIIKKSEQSARNPKEICEARGVKRQRADASLNKFHDRSVLTVAVSTSDPST
jgi:hypothetical protein